MAIHWGATDGHLQVGIDWTISPANPGASATSVDVTWKFYVQSISWSFSDNNENYHATGTHFDNTLSYNNHLNNTSDLVWSTTQTYAISYNSGSVTAGAGMSGIYNGATPSVSVTVNLPNRPSTSTPSAGEAPSAQSITDTSAQIVWSPPDDNGGSAVTSYDLQVDNNSGFNSPEFTSNVNAQSDVATGLSPGTTYYYRVRANNANGHGDWTSGTVTFQTTNTASGPEIPGNFGLSTPATPTSAQFSWGASNPRGGGAVTYFVQIATDPGFGSGTVVNTASPTVTHQAFGSLSPGTNYYARVRASNSGGTSGFSNNDHIITALQPVNPGGGSWTDTGDFATLVNNLAAAVGEKLTHLGSYLERRRDSLALSANTATAVNMNVANSPNTSAGASPPTYVGTGLTDFEIAYSGTYLLEFGVRHDGSAAASYAVGIAVNSSVPYGNGKTHGAGEMHADASAGYMVRSTVVHLDAGDLVGWQVTSSVALSLSGTGIAYGRATMIGF